MHNYHHFSALVVFLFISFLFSCCLLYRYDPLSSCLVDFKGRANMASVKNCQFVVSEPGHEAATPGMLLCYDVTCYDVILLLYLCGSVAWYGVD